LGADYNILEFKGTGHYVGVNLTLPAVGRNLEGNERMYVDGVRSPVIQGTGTEDYFNGGWYFDKGAFTTQTHGAPALGAPFGAYRFHLSDAVPFSSSIRVAIQHGATDNLTDPYGSVAYFYAKPEVLSDKTDDLDVGDAGSESSHNYVAQGSVNRVSLTARFFSDDPAALSETGTAFTGGSSFTVQINPSNVGVVLRRLFDQGSGPQLAVVSINGADAGIWSTPGTNPFFQWREEDFWVPGALTAGQSALDVRIAVQAGTWNEYHYQVFTQRSP
jgi:hypothetical protein